MVSFITKIKSLNRNQIKERLEKNNFYETNYGCWLWTAALNKKGYGLLKIKINGIYKTRTVHRISYYAYLGSIKKGFHVLHKCDIPTCFNPNHLYIGTNEDNNKDKIQKNRQQRGEKISKLKECQVLEIRKLRALGQKLSVISKKYNIQPGHVYRIYKRKTWKHLEDK